MGLDTVELVLAIEEEFGIELANDELAECYTVGQLGNIIRKKLLASQKQFDAFDTWQRMTRIIAEHRSIPADNLKPEMKFVDDLHMD